MITRALLCIMLVVFGVAFSALPLLSLYLYF